MPRQGRAEHVLDRGDRALQREAHAGDGLVEEAELRPAVVEPRAELVVGKQAGAEALLLVAGNDNGVDEAERRGLEVQARLGALEDERLRAWAPDAAAAALVRVEACQTLL